MTTGEGTVLEGRYRLGPVLGRGGTAVVHEGWDLRLDRPVAVKLLKVQALDDPDLRRGFEREACAAGRLAHPHVVEVFDVGESSGRPYLIMERLTGRSLAHRLREGPVDPALGRQLAQQVLSAIAAAHDAGVLHRDIKPSNILWATDGSAKVADFGIAKAMEHLSSGLPGEPTATNVVVGTPAYLAPERIEGLPATPRSDLWSVGVVLYEALTGAKPFAANGALAVAYAITHTEPVPLDERMPDLDPHLKATVHRALQKRPERRFASASEMAAALGAPPHSTVVPESHARMSREGPDTAVIADGTDRMPGRDPQRVVSSLVGELVASGRVRPRSHRGVLLGGALALVAVIALCGSLIPRLVMTSSTSPTEAGSPATAPATTVPTAQSSATPSSTPPSSTTVIPRQPPVPSTTSTPRPSSASPNSTSPTAPFAAPKSSKPAKADKHGDQPGEHSGKQDAG